MSDTPATAANDAPNAEQVAQFLRAHPDFFLQHGGLLADLRIPHASGEAVSLVERQVAVLRERNVELRERLNGLLSVARDNDIIFEKTRALVLALMEAGTLAALAQALARSLVEDFGMAATSLVLVDAGSDLVLPGVRMLATADAEPQVGNLLKGNRVVCGVLRPEELAWAFGDAAGAVGSAAIVPLNYRGALGLLAIGARDPQHFRSGMDTLFVGHIGEVLARQLHGVLPGRNAGGRSRAGG